MYCEGVKGECNLGQQEIAFRYDDALVTCDNHTIYKNGAKEIADQDGKASPSWRSTTSARATAATSTSRCAATTAARCSPTPTRRTACHRCSSSFLAGQLASLRELTLFYAPNINSYKRFVDGLLRADRGGVGEDNRTCSLRVVGHGHGLRIEMPRARRRRQPVPRAGGADRRRPARHRTRAASCETRWRATPTPARRAHVPTTLREAAALFDELGVAREAFGDDVVDHYLNNARVELDAFDAAVTDWERLRGFERL